MSRVSPCHRCSGRLAVFFATFWRLPLCIVVSIQYIFLCVCSSDFCTLKIRPLFLIGEGGVAGDFVDVVNVDVLCRASSVPGFVLFDVLFSCRFGCFLERAVARPLSARPTCGVVVGLPHLGEWWLPSFTCRWPFFSLGDGCPSRWQNHL